MLGTDKICCIFLYFTSKLSLKYFTLLSFSNHLANIHCVLCYPWVVYIFSNLNFYLNACNTDTVCGSIISHFIYVFGS